MYIVFLLFLLRYVLHKNFYLLIFKINKTKINNSFVKNYLILILTIISYRIFIQFFHYSH